MAGKEARFVAPRLFADEGERVPEHVREKWNAIVDADTKTEFSPVDLSLLVLRCIADGERKEHVLLQKLRGVSDCADKARIRVCDAISKLIEEGFLTESIAHVKDTWDDGKIRVFEITAKGEQLAGIGT